MDTTRSETRTETPETDALAQGFKVKATWYNNATWSRDVALLKHARRLERERDELREALEMALLTYHPSWIHPGGDKTGHRLPDPEWVIQARAALRSRS